MTPAEIEAQAQRIVAAYAETGLVPIRKAYFKVDDDGRACGCAAVALAVQAGANARDFEGTVGGIVLNSKISALTGISADDVGWLEDGFDGWFWASALPIYYRIGARAAELLTAAGWDLDGGGM